MTETSVETLALAIRAKRLDEDSFQVPSSKEGRYWYVNVTIRTCRDYEGKGCPALYYSKVKPKTCKHLEACMLILGLLSLWLVPEEIPEEVGV